MKTKTILIIVLLSVILAGCTVRPSAERMSQSIHLLQLQCDSLKVAQNVILMSQRIIFLNYRVAYKKSIEVNRKDSIRFKIEQSMLDQAMNVMTEKMEQYNRSFEQIEIELENLQIEIDLMQADREDLSNKLHQHAAR